MALQPQGQLCPSTALQSFPNALSGPITQEFYATAAKYEPLNMSFQWASQATPSTFRDSTKGVIQLPNGIAANTLRYNNNSYTLTKLQIATGAHSTWVIPASQIPNALSDLILTFTLSSTATGPATPDQILIVVPLLEQSTVTTDPPYLKKMLPDGSFAGFNYSTVVSLGEFFPIPSPSNTMHVYYSLCARGVMPDAPPQNVLVVVQVLGLAVSTNLMELLRKQLNTVNTANPFGTYEPLDGTVFLNQVASIQGSSLTVQVATKGNLRYAYNLGAAIQTAPPETPAEALKVEEVDAYKCVPFDPDTQVVDGKIKVDTRTGELYSQVDAERSLLKDQAKTPSATLLSAEDFVQRLTTAMSVIIGLLGVAVILYILFSGGGGIGTTAETGGFMERIVMRFFSPVVFAVIAGLVGFVVGMALR